MRLNERYNQDDRSSLEEGLSYDYKKHVLVDFGCRKGDIAVVAAFISYWNDETY